MALARKIAYNVVLNSFLKVFSTVALSLLSIRLITGYLGQDGFGKYATILAFFAFFSAIADLGLGSVTAREISRSGADESKILGNVIALRLSASLLLMVLSPIIILLFGYSKEVEIGILIAALATLFSALSTVLNGIFQKYLAMDKVALVEFGGKIFQVGLVVLIVREDWGFLPIAATLLASVSFNALLTLLLSRRFSKFRLHFDFSYWKTFLRESLPMGMTAIITFAYFKMDTILLSVLQSNAEVGIYNVAYKIMENLIFFPAMLCGLILPLLSRYIFTDPEQFKKIADKTFKVFVIIVIPIVLGTWFLADDIVRIVSGADFSEAAPVLQMLIFSLGAIFFGSYFNMLLIVGNAQRKLMQTLFFAALFNVSFNLFMISRYSYIGAATTAIITEIIVVGLTGFLTYKYIHYIPSLEHVGRALVSGAVMGIVLYFLAPVSFLLAGFLGVASYLLMLWMTKAISRSEILSLFQKKESPLPLEPLLP